MGVRDLIHRMTAPKPLAARRFDGAAGGRRWSASPSFGRVSAETLAASGPIRSRAGYFVANNPWAANGVNALVTGLVGTGIVPASAHPDPAVRAEIGRRLTPWMRHADADGRTDFYGLQAAAARGLVIDGESFIHMETRPEGLRLRLLPPELVDESDTRDLGNGGYVVAGVEFDASGRRVAYHVLKARPTDVFAHASGTVRVLAEDMIHICAPLGAGQVRGVSWLAPVLLRLAELDATEDALAVGVKIAALHAGFLVDQNGTGEPFDGDPADISLEPGTVRRLPNGYDIKFSTPVQAQQTADFVAHSVRAIAAGLSVPAHLVSGDLREANYGSLRAGMVAFRQRLEQVQFGTLIPQMADPIYARAVTTLALMGEIPADDFSADFLAAEHYPPAQPWLDPQKDAAAIREAIDSGLMSRRQAVAERGYSVETLDAEIAADREREAGLGLTFTGAPKLQPEASA